MKIPLDATAETIGSVINSNGSKNRSSLLPKALSNEVQVAWNGPSCEFHTLLYLPLYLYLGNVHIVSGIFFYSVSSIDILYFRSMAIEYVLC